MREKIREIIEDLSSKTPLDFIGTGSYASGEAEAKEWGKHKKEAIDNIYEIAAQSNQEVAKIVADNLTKTFLEDSKGTQAVFRERVRQVEGENYDSEHDDKHTDGELAKAAACYAIPDAPSIDAGNAIITIARNFLWPWELHWWKPSARKKDKTMGNEERQRELEKAGALIVAEWERLERLKHAE